MKPVNCHFTIRYCLVSIHYVKLILQRQTVQRKIHNAIQVYVDIMGISDIRWPGCGKCQMSYHDRYILLRSVQRPTCAWRRIHQGMSQFLWEYLKEKLQSNQITYLLNSNLRTYSRRGRGTSYIILPVSINYLGKGFKIGNGHHYGRLEWTT